jgi:uncharacterized protein YukE
MFGSSTLEVAIGIGFVYLLISLVCTIINEAIAACLNQRGKLLFAGISNLLNDPKFTGLAQQIYTHGIIIGMMEGAANPNRLKRLPSYIASRNFALALLDLLMSKGAAETCLAIIVQKRAALEAAHRRAKECPDDPAARASLEAAQTARQEANAKGAAAIAAKQGHAAAEQAAAQVTSHQDLAGLQHASEQLQQALALGRTLAADLDAPLENIRRAVDLLPAGHTRETLYVLVDKTRREATRIAEGAGDRALERLQQHLERWYDDAVNRFTGWYKRWIQGITLMVAVLVVGGSNADTLALANRLSRDNALRSALVAAAQGIAQRPDASAARAQLLADASHLALPLGWTRQTGLSADPSGPEAIPNTASGWARKIFGLFLTVLAASLGAPFWFDTLSRFVNLRGTGIRPAGATRPVPAAGSS